MGSAAEERGSRGAGEQGTGVRGQDGGGRHIGRQIEGAAEDLAIEEENGDASLAALDGVCEGGEKRHDVGRGQRVGVPFVVEEDETFDPGDGGFLGGGRIMAFAQGVTHQIKQFWGLGWHRYQESGIRSQGVFRSWHRGIQDPGLARFPMPRYQTQRRCA